MYKFALPWNVIWHVRSVKCGRPNEMVARHQRQGTLFPAHSHVNTHAPCLIHGQRREKLFQETTYHPTATVHLWTRILCSTVVSNVTSVYTFFVCLRESRDQRTRERKREKNMFSSPVIIFASDCDKFSWDCRILRDSLLP